MVKAPPGRRTPGMSNVAISCEGLGKRYRLGQQDRYKTLRDVISSTITNPFKQPPDSHGQIIWALEDVSFEVNRGDVVGIIGRNGAGKSTLLKILSRITKPTRGHAQINGRVGSLLEVGTGFHPELTGRENIYLNGAILGMRKAEIAHKFDEIVAFAEVEKFVDTPVKRYSSGMYVRLAFAVAAHMETEILLVDEVLAVGDVQFQKKCLGKIGSVAREGITVLFVSHSMAAVQSLCSKGMLIDGGKLMVAGECRKVIEAYVNHVAVQEFNDTTDLRVHPGRTKDAVPVFSEIRIMNGAKEPTPTLFAGEDLVLEFELNPPRAITNPTLGIGVDNAMGLRVFSVITYYSDFEWTRLDRPAVIRCTIPQIKLLPGRYQLSISVGNVYNQHVDAIYNAASFSIEPSDYFGTGRLPSPDLGVVLADSKWECVTEEVAELRQETQVFG
ncbi:MAG TPA: ABC transporter ATP-binding protein [Pyrinomonadaceae bacterium]|nr:ABC transporter ATP-binding protein [Pyrinomonadaceae bacterium]